MKLKQKKPDFLPVDSTFEFAGLNTLTSSTQIAPGETPSAVNSTTFRANRLTKRPGTTQLVAVGSGTEPVVRYYTFTNATGTTFLIAFTPTHMYWYNPAGPSWTDITTQGTIVTLPKFSSPNGWSVATGSFTPGQYVTQATSNAVGIWLTPDSTHYFVGVISGIFDNTHTISVVNTSGTGTLTKAGSTSATTSTGVIPFHGTEDNFIDVTEGVDVNLGRLVVVVNGVDPPIYWDGVASTFKPLPMNISGFLTAKTIAVFNSYLIFANVQTTTDFEPRTAIWSDTGVFTEWLAGNSGVLAEMSFDGEIIRLIPYSTNLVVFSRNTIGCLCYIDPNVIFGSQIYVTGIRAISAQGICNIAPYIYFVGQDNVYIWDGGRTIRSVGDKIRSLLMATINTTYYDRVRLFFDSTLSKMLFIIPTSINTSRVLALESADVQAFQYAKTYWHEQTYPFRAISFGIQITSTNLSQINLVIGTDSGRTNVVSQISDDNGTAINFQWDTPDFTLPQIYESQYARWIEIEFEALGTSVDIYYSTDFGTNFTLAKTVTLSSSIRAQYRVPIDANSRTLRVRFVCDTVGGVIDLNWFRLWLRPGGAR